MSRKKSVSLVLGSGGARGYAHIGAIEVLLEHNFEITSISGSSMGALIGGLYASGTLDDYKRWVLGLSFFDVAKLLDFSLRKNGFIQGEKVFDMIETMIGDRQIETLPITFTAVATDIIRQKEVWLQSGNLCDAIRASIAIPTIFTPKKIGGHYLVDGSVLNPLPIAPTISDSTDLTIAVNVNFRTSNIMYETHQKVSTKTQKKPAKKHNLFLKLEQKIEDLLKAKEKDAFEDIGIFGVMGHSLDTMQKVLTEYKIAGFSPDININIPGDACEFYEFNKAKEMIALGRKITQEAIAPLIQK
ncbi:patatin-like phospholipase family protein [Sulfurospirillum sp. 1612]|uniref:patatin-like phospholipase family protein n=1 Tax=Sulfurospirillum sp. 1612 TaxID=3094835 RepID=UPI002F93B6E7